jgi:3-hydroxyisobutyrate dehydrogenase-like beta-hydroxyacid dehydrogenase
MIMGTAMMRNLVKDGFEVVGYDIVEVAMARLIENGGIAAASPRDVAEKIEILITSLPNVEAFEQVMTGQAASPRATVWGRSSSNAALCRSR